MVTKFDDGKAVKPRELFAAAVSDTDSTLSVSDVEQNEEVFEEEDSFFVKYPLEEESNVFQEETNVFQIVLETDEVEVEAVETVYNVSPEIKSQSAFYILFKILLATIFLTYCANRIAHTNAHDFEILKENFVLCYEDPQLAFQNSRDWTFQQAQDIKSFVDENVVLIKDYDFDQVKKDIKVVEESLWSSLMSAKSQVTAFMVDHTTSNSIIWQVEEKLSAYYMVAKELALQSKDQIQAQAFIMVEQVKDLFSVVCEELADAWKFVSLESKFVWEEVKFRSNAFLVEFEAWLMPLLLEVKEWILKALTPYLIAMNPTYVYLKRGIQELMNKITAAGIQQLEVLLKVETFNKIAEFFNEGANNRYLDNANMAGVLIAGGLTFAVVAFLVL